MRYTINNKYFSVDLSNDWEQLIGKYNWYEFNLLKMYFENDVIHGCSEIEIYLLGFGIRIYWVSNKKANNKKFAEYEKRLKEEKFVDITR